MSNVNLNLYRIFCKVAQSKSYSEASEKLNLSVANISTQITNLEEQLGLKLFNRESKGVTLTENGKELYEIVNKSISSFDFAEKMAKDKNEIASGKIKIGCPSHFTTPYFIRLADPAYRLVERHLPKRFHFLIERYSTEVVHDNATGQLWSAVRTRYLWRLALYTAVLVTISLLGTRWLLPLMLRIAPAWGRLFCTLITVGVMSPFLLALSLPSSKKSERRRLRDAGQRFNVPLIIMSIFRLLIALGFLVYVLGRLWSWGVGFTAGVAVFLIILFALSKKVKRKMGEIEKRFIDNLNERELRRSGRNNNVPRTPRK